jgi:hypothetical protein
VNAGLVVLTFPLGDTSVTGPGNGPADTVMLMPLLHGPLPSAFLARTHQLADPGSSALAGVNEQVPVPAAHPACAALSVCLSFCTAPAGSAT